MLWMNYRRDDGVQVKKKLLAILGAVVLTAGGYGAVRWYQSDNVSQELAESEYALGQTLDAPTAAEPGTSTGPKSLKNLDAYPELKWDDMIPADWDPTAPLKNLQLDKLKDGDPEATKALKAIQEAWKKAPVQASLNGKVVRIPGFAVPLDGSQKETTEMLLVPYFGACVHTPPPPSNQVVHVRFSKPVPAVASMTPYWVWGTMTTSLSESSMGAAGYQLQADGHEVYQ